jgi:photosystem II stability/assembly factor-like uncharacterized protein
MFACLITAFCLNSLGRHRELKLDISATVDPQLYRQLKWRMIGPFRGGRTVGAVGVPSSPNTFYIGVNNGGVWKTTDAGRTWKPIFDSQDTGSIGCLAVAPSDPSVIYVGSGEGLQRPDLSVGDGVYRSMDGGNHWTHLGLKNGQQIAAILVDPRDSKRIFVSVLGHPYGPNEERGIYRSTDGGNTFTHVLYRGPDTGGMAMAFDPKNPDVVYADLFAARQGPWENGVWRGPDSGLYKSTDGGSHWQPLTKGLPGVTEGLGRIGFAIAPSNSSRIYALVDAEKNGGLYRSDDAGASWRLQDADPRIWGRGDDFAEVRVDPQNEDIVYSANTSTYRSTDGGRNFVAWKGSPGGDDYHTLWINPTDSKVMLLAGDQGAAVTVNGGESWSSWHNQPTAQFYHVATDNRFPYWVYGGQQESGSAGVASRGPLGQITFREWHPVGAEEYAYIAPDPKHPGVIYGGNVTRYDESTGQVQEVGPEAIRSGKYRFLRTKPLLFSPVDQQTLYLAGNVLFKTTNAGQGWEIISPDLSREKAPPPAGSVFREPKRRGVIYAVGPSYQKLDTIWAGTDDGLVWRTTNGGKTWSNVTPSQMTPWSKVAQIDPGRFDNSTAYVAINRIKLDDLRPHIYQTHDGGKSWSETVTGLPDNAPVNAVREDPVRKGLLYAATERAVYVSFDEGLHWQSLRQNMPTTSIRDVIVKGDDLVVATHGRSFWILDDISPLRELKPELSESYLFRPQTATRVRWNVNSDTPLPPDEPAGANPPDGAIIDYFLAKDAKSVALDIVDKSGRTVRHYESTEDSAPLEERGLDVPSYWLRPVQRLGTDQGPHRFLWNMRFGSLKGAGRGYTMEAVYEDTPTEPAGPWALPGTYSVKLTVDGVTMSQPLKLRMDPRVKAAPAAIRAQYDMALGSYDWVEKLRGKGKEADQLANQFEQIIDLVSGADSAPTKQTVDAYQRLVREAKALKF